MDPLKGIVFEFKKDVLYDFENYFLNIESFDVMEDELFLFIRKSPDFDYKIKEKRISLLLVSKSVNSINIK